MREEQTSAFNKSTDPNMGYLPALPPVDQEQRKWMLGEWRQAKDFGEGVSSIVNLQDGKYILVFGGIDPKNPQEYYIGTTIFLYDPVIEKWSFFGHMPQPRSYHATAMINGSIYITGGFDPLDTINGEAVCTNTTFQFNIRTKIWQMKCHMHDCRACHGIVTKDETIIVFGGKDGPGNILNSVESFDIRNESWTVLKTMPNPTMGMTVTILNELIYIIGGVARNGNYNNDDISSAVLLYDNRQDRWSTTTSLPIALAYCSSVTIRKKILLFGGMSSSQSSSKIVLHFNPKSSTWQEIDILSTAKHSMACAKIDKQVFLIGGISSESKEALNEMDIFYYNTYQITEGAAIPHPATGATAVAIFSETTGKQDCPVSPSKSNEKLYSASVSIQRAYRKFKQEHSQSGKTMNSTGIQVCIKDASSEDVRITDFFNTHLNKVMISKYVQVTNKHTPSMEGRTDTVNGNYRPHKSKHLKTVTSPNVTWPPSPNPNKSSSEVYRALGRECPIDQLFGECDKRNYMKITPFFDPNLGMVPNMDNLYKKTRSILGLKRLELIPQALIGMKNAETLQQSDAPVILLIGGFNPKDSVNISYGKTVLRYLVQKDRWEFCGMIPESRNHHAAAVLSNTIFMTGGYDPDLRHFGEMIATKTCLAIDIDTWKWHQMAEMITARAHHGMVAINDKLYVVGGRGCNGRALDSIEEYDPKLNTWKLLQPMECPCIGMAVVPFNDCIWILGGLCFENDSCYYKYDEQPPIVPNVACYDIHSRRWSRKPPLKTARAFSGGVVVDGKILLCGGCGASKREKEHLVSLNSIELYNPEEYWEEEGHLNIPSNLISSRHCAAIAAIDSCVYSFGGIDSHAWVPLSKNEVYFLEDDTTKLIQSLPFPVTGAAAVVLPSNDCRSSASSFTRIVRNRLETSV